MNEFASYNVVQTGFDDYQVQHGDDSQAWVQFYYKDVRDEEKSEAAGRHIARQVEYIKIMFPGDQFSITDRPVRHERSNAQPSDIERWPAKYEAFKKGHEAPLEGTPIADWGMLNEAMRAELRHAGFHTVEQIAGVSDGVISSAGNFGLLLDKMRRHAEVFLKKSKDHELEHKLTAELDRQKADNAVLQDQVRELSARMEAMAREVRAGGAPSLPQTANVAPAANTGLPDSFGQHGDVTSPPEGLEQFQMAQPSAPVHSSLDDLPEPEPLVEPVPVADDDTEALLAEAKALHIKGAHLMKPETLRARIAEAKG